MHQKYIIYIFKFLNFYSNQNQSIYPTLRLINSNKKISNLFIIWPLSVILKQQLFK